MPRVSKKPHSSYTIFYNDDVKDYRADYVKYKRFGATATGTVLASAKTEEEAKAITARLNAEYRAKFYEYDHAKSK